MRSLREDSCFRFRFLRFTMNNIRQFQQLTLQQYSQGSRKEDNS